MNRGLLNQRYGLNKLLSAGPHEKREKRNCLIEQSKEPFNKSLNRTLRRSSSVKKPALFRLKLIASSPFDNYFLPPLHNYYCPVVDDFTIQIYLKLAFW